jgi:hypothetical protein
MWRFWSITTLLNAKHFITEEGGRLGFSCLIEVFFMSVENIFFHTSGRSIFCLYIHEAKAIFQRFFYTIQADIYFAL